MGGRVEIGDLKPGTVVQLVAGTLDAPDWPPSQQRRAMVWSKDYYVTRVVWLDGWQPLGEEHLADCVTVVVLDETPPPSLFPHPLSEPPRG